MTEMLRIMKVEDSWLTFDTRKSRRAVRSCFLQGLIILARLGDPLEKADRRRPDPPGRTE